MSEIPDINPFQAPVSTTVATASMLGNEQTAQLLRQTRPWTITIAILLALGAALAILVGIAIAGMSMVAGFGGAPGMPSWFGFVFGPVYILFGVLYVIPSVILFKYSSRISNFLITPSTDCLNSALSAQKSFWKFCGIATISIIVLYFLMIIVFVFVGVSSNTNL